MDQEAKDILDRLREEYSDDPDALELINNSYDEILSFHHERAVLLAKQAEVTLSCYFKPVEQKPVPCPIRPRV